jgi:predicted ribosome quality control (RQC) complex YloA/Tae2 family protein
VLSLAELRRAARLLDARIGGHRLQAVAQPDERSLILTTYGGGAAARRGARQHVRLSCRPESARVSLCAEAPRAGRAPGTFVQYLRAHVLGATVGGVRLLGDDRQIALRLRAREGEFDLLLAILGQRSNLVLLAADERIVAALRPLADTRPELSLGEKWRAPASAAPAPGQDRFAAEPDERLLETIEAAYAAGECVGQCDALTRRIEQALRKGRRNLERRLEKLERDLAAARADATLERQGELLKSVLSRVRKGDERVVARDYETEMEVEIRLDPTKTPSENLAHLFKRYRKAVRTLTQAGAQQHAAREALERLSERCEELECLAGADDAEGLQALETFAARSDVRPLLSRHAPDRQRRSSRSEAKPSEGGAPRMLVGGRPVPARLQPRRYASAGGLEIWVGRSDAGNDHLTTRLARGNDLFFHLDGAPGSHVVLRTEGRSDPPSEALLDACELAVHFSKQRNASRADVHVVPIKNVRKPKGAKPGLVMVHGGKTIHLRRIPQRLRRVLEARIEE